jgi:hypothetical protein
MDRRTRRFLRVLLNVAPLLLFLGWEMGVRVCWTEAEKARAVTPGHLGEPRVLLEKRLGAHGWQGRELPSNPDSDPDYPYSRTEYRRWPGLYFTVNYYRGRVHSYDFVDM